MKKLAIITGASKGIGLATAKQFMTEKWQVVSLSRQTCPIPGVVNIAVDLSCPQELGSQLATLIPHAETADQISLIHNAGACPSDSIRTLALNTLQEVMAINVIAPAILTKSLLPYMAQGSSIIYIGSTLSEKAVPNTASYVTSKHAIAGLMKATCQDLDSSGIHTCCICPGLTDTEMLRERTQNQVEILTQLANIASFKRLVEPMEIAELVWFCANHPVINGAILHANLGQVER